MKDEALALFDDGIDLVSLTVDVDFINLGDTEEYKQYRDLQSVSLYDVVHISHAPLGFADKLQVKSYEWNAITKQYTRLTLGDVFDAEIKTIPAYQFRNGSVKISKLNKDDMERYIKKVVQS
ncbi:MAG: hypothetical protein MJZ55_03195 [Paludibacteraceae bacterium]|nr:hypothetical protein [Paludibacteraceae bacterium]